MAKNDYWADTGAYEIRKPVPGQKDTKTVRIVLLVIGIALVLLVAFIGFVQLILHMQKDSAQYKAAYSYLVSSDAFAALDADEEDIRMNQYSSNTNYSADSGEPSRTVTIGFMVKFRSFYVVCHWEDGAWRVCEDCTAFD